MSELQARRDAQTRAEISSAAIRLFAERGFAETTVEEVAQAAGVSRRTAYRHYASKEDMLFEQPRLWLEVLLEVAAARKPNDSTRDVCRQAVLAVAERIEATKDDVLPGYAVVVATPSLRSRVARTNRDWLEAYMGLLAADIAPDDSQTVLQASILAGALVGGTDQAAIFWFLHPGTSLVSLTEEVLEIVEPLWPDECRAIPDS